MHKRSKQFILLFYTELIDKTCNIKISLGKDSKIVQINIKKANQNPLDYFVDLGFNHLEFPVGTEREHVEVNLRIKGEDTVVTNDTLLTDNLLNTEKTPKVIFRSSKP